ncbi:MAG: NADAR family protein [Bacteriovoracaceae bacterium]|nr:NADAR family protein [Bacteriovoracaceae bacterium]
MKIILTSIFLLLTSGCSGTVKSNADYPESWWKPFPEDEAHSWEILPQAAGPGEVILSKRTELGILSNFAPTPFKYDGKHYASLEGFWQMMKFPENEADPRASHPGLTWDHTRHEVSQMVGFEAKRAGSHASKNMKKMGINWVSFKNKRMTYRTPAKGEHCKLIVAATREKIRQNPKVKEILLKTGNLKLRADHKQKANTPPAWKYFEILMEIREIISDEN